MAPVGDAYTFPSILSPLNLTCSTSLSISNSLELSTVKYLLELSQSKTVPVICVPSESILSMSSPFLKLFGCNSISNWGNHLSGINVATELTESKTPG